MKSVFQLLLAAPAFAAALLSIGAARAEIVIAAQSVTGPPDDNPFTEWVHTIDQSGLSPTYTSGVTSFGAYAALSPRHGGANDSLGASKVSPPGNVDYDLGSSYPISRLLFWNTRFGGTGVTGMQVLTSLTSDFSSPLTVDAFSVVSDGNNSSAGLQVFDLTDATARFVRVRVTAIAGGSGFSYGEVAFTAVPESPNGIAAVAVLAGIAARLRRFFA